MCLVHSHSLFIHKISAWCQLLQWAKLWDNIQRAREYFHDVTPGDILGRARHSLTTIAPQFSTSSHFWETTNLQENHQIQSDCPLGEYPVTQCHHCHFESAPWPRLEEVDLVWAWGRVLLSTNRNHLGSSQMRKEKLRMSISNRVGRKEWGETIWAIFKWPVKYFALARATKPIR